MAQLATELGKSQSQHVLLFVWYTSTLAAYFDLDLIGLGCLNIDSPTNENGLIVNVLCTIMKMANKC